MSDIPDSLRAALGGRYDLVRVLGRGGMATVYLANDGKHHRQVAIKVLRSDLAASIGADRFLKEIEIAARLTHPHILALHDSGEADGVLYYVMPFIDGGSLRTRLESSVGGRLEPALALSITGHVAGALSYAHRMGVLHRDIKPENILFAQGLPVVADFGIAKAVSTAGGENLTRTGFPLGTPGYMSPEQAAGLTDLDVRTDVYSLAVVCYEMLTGRTPGRWPTEDAVRAGRFLDASGTHRTVLDTLPPAIEPALVRAMAIRHDQRTATPDDLVAALHGREPRPAMRATSALLPVPVEPPPPAPVAAPRRKYNDAEVQEVLRRAAELEASNPTSAGNLTIGSIQQAAAEAGIDPSLVRQAVAAMGRPSTPVPPAEDPDKPAPKFSARWWAGGPLKVTVERVVQGTLSESDCAFLVEEIRMEIGSNGITSSLGRSVSWVTQRAAGSGFGRDLQVNITMRAGQTRIVMRENLGAMAGGIFGGVGGGVGGGGLGPIMAGLAGQLGAPLAAGVAAVLWIATTMAGARSIYYYSAKKRRQQLESLADRLASIARGLIDEAAELPRNTPPERLKA